MNTPFKQIVIDLRDAGYKDPQIAQLCKCTRQYIWKLGNGKTKEPSFRIGLKLTKLHDALQ